MYSLPNSRHYKDSEMIYEDYDQEMHRYDAFCYEYYCRLRQSNAVLFQAMYENWYRTNNFYASHYGWNRDLNFSSEFSNSERSSSLMAQSNEEWQKHNEYSSTTGMENDRPEIDFHYYDSYFYGFYNVMRRVNPTMYAVLYAKWCASHHLPMNEVYQSQIPHNTASRESPHSVRDQLPKDFITDHYDTDGSEILTSDSSVLPEAKNIKHFERSGIDVYGQITSRSGNCGNDRDITSEVHLQLNGGITSGRVIPKFIESVDTQSRQEIKQLELSDRNIVDKYGRITSESANCENDRDSISEVDLQLNGGFTDGSVLPKFLEPGDMKPTQQIKVISSEVQPSCTSINKSTNKIDDLSEKKQGKSWINTLLTKIRFSRTEAHLPDDDCPTWEVQIGIQQYTEGSQQLTAKTITTLQIIWDSERKQWIDTAKNESTFPGTVLLPPKSSGIVSCGANNVYRLKKSRDVRSKYVDVLQTSKQISNVIMGFSSSSEKNLYL